MVNLVGEAGAVLAPLLATGGAAAAAKLAEDLGRDGADALERVLGRLKARISSDSPTQGELEAALTGALQAGEISEPDLRAVVTAVASSANVNRNLGPSINIGSVSGGTVNAGNSYNIHGDFLQG